MKDGDTLILKTVHKAYRCAKYAHLYKISDFKSFKKVAGQTVIYDAAGNFFDWISVRKKDGSKTMIKGYEIAKIMEAE